VIDEEATRLGQEAARQLAELACCEIAPGLTDAEFDRIEAEFDFEFADDHRAFLAAGLPVNSPFEPEPGVYYTWRQPWPDWRNATPDDLRSRLDRPVYGVLSDVEDATLWIPAWGERPTDTAKALEIAKPELAEVPKLVPVYAHRFLPAGRGTFGHPVLSIHQTDIIYYGMDLADYIHHEFGGPGLDRDDPAWQPKATVPFWKDFL
jgi:hypothetical protein